MLQARITVKFQDDQATINKDGVTIAVAECCGNLFQLKIKIKNQVANISKVENSNLWHKRFGYISNSRLNELAQTNMVHGMGNVSPVEFCEIVKLRNHLMVHAVSHQDLLNIFIPIYVYQ